MTERVFERFSRRKMALAAAGLALGVPTISAEHETATFTEADVRVFGTILDLNPDLRAVVDATRLLRNSVSFPIENRTSIAPVFERPGGTVTVGRHVLNLDAALAYLPESFFPIDTEEQLISRLLIAFQRGQMHHAYEASVKRVKRSYRDATELRSPWLSSTADYSIEAWR